MSATMAPQMRSAERFRRLWHIAEEIAEHPGRSRRELADLYCLSERQVQADLNLIRSDMALPLVRRGGYRFESEAAATTGHGGFALGDGLALFAALKDGRRVGRQSKEGFQRLIRKLPALFAPHIQPLMRRTVDAMILGGDSGRIWLALMDALVGNERVALVHAGEGAFAGMVRVELLIPYLRSWWALVTTDDGRSRMVALDEIAAVQDVAAPARNQEVAA